MLSRLMEERDKGQTTHCLDKIFIKFFNCQWPLSNRITKTNVFTVLLAADILQFYGNSVQSYAGTTTLGHILSHGPGISSLILHFSCHSIPTWPFLVVFTGLFHAKWVEDYSVPSNLYWILYCCCKQKGKFKKFYKLKYCGIKVQMDWDFWNSIWLT